MRKVLALVLALCAPWPLAAQNAITQEGTVLKDSPMMFRGNNRARQGATVQGAPTGQTVTTGDSVVGGRCDYSAPIDSPDGYYRLCLNAATGSIVMDGTKQPPKDLTIVINGTVYTVPINTTITGTDAVVGNNAGLKAVMGAPGKRLVRMGYYVIGDGGSAAYNWSASNCAAADDGSQVQPTGGTGCWLLDPNTAMNVRVFGAHGDGTSDDTTAIQNNINFNKQVRIDPGTYCIKTGPLVVAADGTSIRGSNRQTTILSACGADVSILDMSGYRSGIDELRVIGSQNPLTTKNTINLLGGGTYPHCAECEITNSRVEGGYNAVNVNAYEVYLTWSRFEFSYGPALVYFTNTGGYIFRNKFDQSYPAASPDYGISPPAPWISGHTYATRDLAQITYSGRTFLLQAMNGGQSGSTPPVPASYGTNIVDGAVTWQLSSPDGYHALWFDSNSGYDAFVSYSDFSSNFTTAIQITNTLGGSAPHFIYFDHLTLANNLRENIYIDAGFGFNIVDSHFGNCLVNPCSNISVQPGFQGDLLISRNWIGSAGNGGPTSGGNGVYLGGGYSTIISDNIFTTGTTAISVAANVQDFQINNNDFASGVFGCSLNGIYINPGTSNYYTVMGNNLSCVTNPLQDNGTGTEKQILNVSTPTTLRGLPATCTGHPAGTLRNNAGVVNVCP